MPTHPNQLHELAELDRTVTRAEVEGDVATLDALATDDFTLVGPVGFVLDKQQWLERYRGGELRTIALAFEDAVTRVHGDCAIRIGRHVQEAEFRDARSTVSSAPPTSPSATANAGGSPASTSARSAGCRRSPNPRRTRDESRRRQHPGQRPL